MLFDSRTGQCIGPCAPSFATLPPAALCSSSSLPSSIPSEIPSKRKKPSSSFSSSSHSSTSTNTLQRKLRKREKAKAQSSRNKDKKRAKQSARCRRSRDKHSHGASSKQTAQRQKKARSPSRRHTAWTADLRPGRPKGIAAPTTSDGDRYRAKPGPSGTDSRHPSKQDRSRSPQRARLILGRHRCTARTDWYAQSAPSSWQPFHPHPGYQGPPPAPYGYGSWKVGMGSWQSMGGQQHGQAGHLPKQPP